MCFIRINPATAPLNPPGAAPTLTTVYDEADGTLPSQSASPSDFLSGEPPRTAAKQGSKRKSRLGLFAKPAPASAVVKGTNKEIKRVQGIAASLDLEADLSADLEPARSDGPRMEVERRRGTVVGVEEPNRIVSGGDARLDVEEETRASIGAGLHGGKRRRSIG